MHQHSVLVSYSVLFLGFSELSHHGQITVKYIYAASKNKIILTETLWQAVIIPVTLIYINYKDDLRQH